MNPCQRFNVWKGNAVCMVVSRWGNYLGHLIAKASKNIREGNGDWFSLAVWQKIFLFSCDLLVDVLVLWLFFAISLKSFCRFLLFIYNFMSGYDGFWLWRLTVIALFIVESSTSEVVFILFIAAFHKNIFDQSSVHTRFKIILRKVLSVWPLLCLWVPPIVVSCLLHYCWCLAVIISFSDG